jgi:hypothetical protein
MSKRLLKRNWASRMELIAIRKIIVGKRVNRVLPAFQGEKE